MNHTRYRLSSQLGSGRDGVRYRAIDRNDGVTVEAVLLREAQADLVRWPAIARRLRQASMIDHPSARRILDLKLEADPPFVILEWLDGPTFAEAGREEDEAISRTIELAKALAAGQRFGMVHGKIAPGSVRLRKFGGPVLDWTGLEDGISDTVAPTHQLDGSCLAPELAKGGELEAASDVFALGVILDWRLAGFVAGDSELDYVVARLLGEMLSEDPAARPSSRMVASRLAVEVAKTRITQHLSRPNEITADSSVTTEFGSDNSLKRVKDKPLDRERLGRFRLLEPLGEGGMGTVYRAEDLSDGSIVAIKVLREAFADRPESLRRFHKEARLLSEVNNARVANLIEVNEDEGVHYIALEFVDGINLAEWLKARGTIEERPALAILADVARALEAAHERGIVHRDIKPENILVVRDLGSVSKSGDDGFPRVKLSDFGLARHVIETESLVLTRDGAVLGTPLYMSPEQCAGDSSIGAAADVYAMGATLFTLLAGRPPFQGELPLIVMAKHRTEPIPDLKRLVPSISDAACSIVNKSLSKLPEQRYASAGEMLGDLERLLRGEPTGLELHPRLPDCDPRDIVCFDWQWDLEASSRALWPLVSNTERFNRAIGLNSVQFDLQPDPSGGTQVMGAFRKSGIDFSWREHPFEWVEGRRMGVVREFDRGPFEWFVSVVELSPKSGGGTTLTHQVKIKPRGLVGRTIAAFEIGARGRKGIERVYRRIDAALTGKLGRDSMIDPYEAPEPLSIERRRRLESWLDSLGAKGFEPMVVERLGDFLELAPSQEVARIRPLALARRLGVDAGAMVDTCFRGAADGVLMLLWDILCPVCRIPSQVLGTLRSLKDHGHCEACRLDFELDFENSVEVIFRVHPEIRETDLGTYCVGGPAHSPHVLAQARVAAGERMLIDLSLETGSYRLRGPQLPHAIDFRVEPGHAPRKWEVDLKQGPVSSLPRTLRTGTQVLDLTNRFDREILIRIERLAPREDALTAARASSLAIFRELFPGEVLSPGQLINLDTVTLLVTDIDRSGDLYAELGDAKAFGILFEQFQKIEQVVRQAGGALIKTFHEGSVSAFADPSAAVASALELVRSLQEGKLTRDLRLKIGIHRGPAMVATLNEHLDYFGSTVSIASHLPKLARGGQIVLTRPVAADPRVSALLKERDLVPDIFEVEVEGLTDPFVHRLIPRDADDPGAALDRNLVAL
jgi:serine/threonine protein kinase/class 3 adenylate cyclase